MRKYRIALQKQHKQLSNIIAKCNSAGKNNLEKI